MGGCRLKCKHGFIFLYRTISVSFIPQLPFRYGELYVERGELSPILVESLVVEFDELFCPTRQKERKASVSYCRVLPMFSKSGNFVSACSSRSGSPAVAMLHRRWWILTGHGEVGGTRDEQSGKQTDFAKGEMLRPETVYPEVDVRASSIVLVREVGCSLAGQSSTCHDFWPCLVTGIMDFRDSSTGRDILPPALLL